MALKTLVKLSNVNNLSDARYGAGMGVSLMGFNISRNLPDYIEKDTFKEITDWISGVDLVAEFTTETVDEVLSLLSGYDVDFIQTQNHDVAINAEQLPHPVILQLNLNELPLPVEKNLLPFNGKVTYFLIENDRDELNEQAMEHLKIISSKFPVIISFGITENNVNAILETINPAGIALKGGNEIKPGIRDFDAMADILEQLEELN